MLARRFQYTPRSPPLENFRPLRGAWISHLPGGKSWLLVTGSYRKEVEKGRSPGAPNGLRYYSPTGIPSHTAHRIEGRGKKGEQGSQRRLAHSAASDVAFTGASRESSGSGTLGVAVLGQGRSTQFSRPAPSHLAWYPRLSSIHRSQPLCSSEHPPKTPGPIGLSPPKNGRSGLVHPGTDDRQAAPSAEYYYTSRSHTYEQISPERHEYAFHFGRGKR